MDMSMTVELQLYIFYVFSGFCLMLCLPLYLCYVDMLDICGLCEWVENCVEWKLKVVSGTDPFSDEYFAFFSIVNVKVVAVTCITVVIYLLFSFSKDIWRFYGSNIPPVSIQHDGNLGGVMAVAFATDLLQGIDPSLRNYEQGVLRKHL